MAARTAGQGSRVRLQLVPARAEARRPRRVPRPPHPGTQSTKGIVLVFLFAHYWLVGTAPCRSDGRGRTRGPSSLTSTRSPTLRRPCRTCCPPRKPLALAWVCSPHGCRGLPGRRAKRNAPCRAAAARCFAATQAWTASVGTTTSSCMTRAALPVPAASTGRSRCAIAHARPTPALEPNSTGRQSSRTRPAADAQVFGHPLVSILDGGLPEWLDCKLPVEGRDTPIRPRPQVRCGAVQIGRMKRCG